MKYYAIVVWQKYVLTPRRYKLRCSGIPSLQRLRDLGVDFQPQRNDVIHFVEVPVTLYDALSEFAWLRD